MQENRIVFFDGVCNFCNQSVQWLIKRDLNNHLLFAPLQGETAKKILKLDNKLNVDSIVFYMNGQQFYKSTAVLKVLAQLGFFYKMSIVFYLIPSFLRDIVYDWIAKNRYKWFGKQSACMIPNDGIKAKFLL